MSPAVFIVKHGCLDHVIGALNKGPEDPLRIHYAGRRGDPNAALHTGDEYSGQLKVTRSMDWAAAQARAAEGMASSAARLRIPALRVGQVDAELLDEELLGLLTGQATEAVKYLGTRMHTEWREEIGLVLRAALFKFSIWDHDASYGAALQGLRYVHSKKLTAPSRQQKLAFGLVTVLGRYLWHKWDAWRPLCRSQILHKLSDSAQTVHGIFSLVSFLVFLTDGKHRTITDRVLGMRLRPMPFQPARNISLDYLNRQLVWHSFTEFLLFLLPIVGVRRWQRWLQRAWHTARRLTRPQTLQKAPSELPEQTCAICHDAGAEDFGSSIGTAATDITNPYESIPCQCVYCYVCLISRIEAEHGDGWTCLRCGTTVTSCKPWSGDLLSVGGPDD